ncbi:hypothetical protein V6Z11_A13G005600 [Gossypium hirsutum]
MRHHARWSEGQNLPPFQRKSGDRREERALITASICVSTRYRAWNHGTYEG